MILVTGGSGYLAGRIIESLIFSKIKFRVATSKKQYLSNLFQTKFQENFEIIELNQNTKNFSELLENVTIVIHCVSLNSNDSEKKPDLAKKVNVDLSKRLIDECINRGIKKFLYFSTIHVYGGSLIGNFDEENKTNPASIYAKTHLDVEDYLINHNKNEKFHGQILRLSNAVGPPLFLESNCWNLLVNDIVKQSVINKEITIRSNKYIKRDFFPISALVNFLLLNIKNEINFNSNLINFSSSQSLTIEEICNLVSSNTSKILNKEIKINYLEKNHNSTDDLFINNSNLKKLVPNLKFELDNEIINLIKKSINWFL